MREARTMRRPPPAAANGSVSPKINTPSRAAQVFG